MKEVVLQKDWTVRAGLIIPAGSTVKVAAVFAEQLKKAGMLKEESSKSKSK